MDVHRHKLNHGIDDNTFGSSIEEISNLFKAFQVKNSFNLHPVTDPTKASIATFQTTSLDAVDMIDDEVVVEDLDLISLMSSGTGSTKDQVSKLPSGMYKAKRFVILPIPEKQKYKIRGKAFLSGLRPMSHSW